MKRLKVDDARAVIKIGDTVSDILEGKKAGVYSVFLGVGSSALGLTKTQYESLSAEDQEATWQKAWEVFLAHGADAVIDTLAEAYDLVQTVNKL